MENHEHIVPGDKSPGLVCDNPACDYTDETVSVEQLKDHLNSPCPKCGENLLTQEDYDNFLKVQEVIAFINSISADKLEVLGKALNVEVPEELKDLDPTQKVLMRVSTHKNISTEIMIEKSEKPTTEE